MKLLKVLPLILIILCLGVVGGWKYWVQPADVQDPDFKIYEISVDNRIRRYFVRTPVETTRKWPVVLGFHGGAGNGLSFEGRSRLSEDLKNENVLLVLPEGIRRYWSDGAGGRREIKSVDDVKFIRKLIQKLSEDFPIDSNRVFAVGYSRGGTLSIRLSCELSDLIMGAVVVGASMPAPLQNQCHFQKPVSLLLIHGTDDPVSPYDGGRIGINWFFLGRHGGTEIGVEATLSFWRNQLDCKKQEVTEEKNVKRIYDFECLNRSFVESYIVKGMGHAWPPYPRRFSFIMGETNQNLDANALILNFIRDLTKNE